MVYRPEPLPHWRLAAAIDPTDLEAQLVIALNGVAQAQPEGAFLLQRLASRYPNQKDRAIQVLQLALDRYLPSLPSRKRPLLKPTKRPRRAQKPSRKFGPSTKGIS